MLSSLVTSVGNVKELERWDNTPFSSLLPRQLAPAPAVLAPSAPTPADPVGSPSGTRPGEKGKRNRTAFSPEQLRALEAHFRRARYLARDERAELAARLRIGDKQVKVWFQNRRMKHKRDSEKSGPESPCSSLTDSSGASDPADLTSGSPDPSMLENIEGSMNVDNGFGGNPQICMEDLENEGYIFPDAIHSEFSNPQIYSLQQKTPYYETVNHNSMPPYFGAGETFAEYSYQEAPAIETPFGYFCRRNEYQQNPANFQYPSEYYF